MRNLMFITFLILALMSCTKAPTIVFTFRDVLTLASFGVLISAALIYITVLWIKGILKWVEEKTGGKQVNTRTCKVQ